ncbi:MAG: protein kinase [Cyanobacteria bacterium HKST-UBA02]|nr:protein kinase [Cyanobacteria bacterium HKST-UBA02]
MTSFCRACHWFFEEDRETCPRDSFPLTQYDPASIIGCVVGGKYKIEKPLVPVGNVISGSGTDLESGESVAIRAYGKDNVDVDAFIQTVSVWKSLDHSNIAPILDIGVDEQGLVYVISKFFYGQTLAKFVDDNGPTNPELALHLLRQMANGLDYLRANGIVHQTIMPANVIIIDDGHMPHHARVFNWLLPSICFKQAGIDGPSPLYRSPESIDGAPPTVASDVYSIGCTIFEIITGVPPFPGSSEADILRRQKEELPLTIAGTAPELSIPGMVDEMVMKCLDKNPGARYQNYETLIKDLLDAARSSRIFLPGGGDDAYEVQAYGQKANTANLPSESAPLVEEAGDGAEKTEAKENEDELPPETREELEGTIKGLRSHVYTLTGIAIVVLVGLALVMGYEGSDEDHGPLWKKLLWQYQMSQGDAALKKQDFKAAAASYEQAQSLTDDFQDNQDRKLKTLKGLLSLYEAQGDEKEAHAYRQEIVELDKQRLEGLFKDADSDADQVKDVDLSVANMSQKTAEEYSQKFIARADEYIKKNQPKKAESFLLKALSVEEKVETGGHHACVECANRLAEEARPGEHLAEITDLLERSLALSDKRHGKKENRLKTLLNLGLAQARKGQFDKAEKSIKEAQGLAGSLGIKDDGTVTSILAEYSKLLDKAK